MLILLVEDIFDATVELEVLADIVASEDSGDGVVVDEEEISGEEVFRVGAVIGSADFGSHFPAISARDESGIHGVTRATDESLAGVVLCEVGAVDDVGVEIGIVRIHFDGITELAAEFDFESGSLGVDLGRAGEGERIDIDEVLDVGLEVSRAECVLLTEYVLTESEFPSETFFGGDL